jgi:glutathione S-transferase
MLRLHGFSASNYYNVAKLALLEKELGFEEVLTYTGADETHDPEYLQKSPLGKVPCLETEEGFISESRCIVEYLERAYPQRPLYPTGTFARAKVLELTQIIDLYLELPARRLIPNLFRRTPAPERVANEVREVVGKGAKALSRLARFDAFLLGESFGAADIAAVIHLPMVRNVIGTVLKEDPLANRPELDRYLARMEARPTVQKIRADHAANFPEFVGFLKTRYAAPDLTAASSP